MARPKKIEDQLILKLTEEYYLTKCDGKAKNLKLPALAAYIREKANCPTYEATALRKNKIAREYINSIMSASDQVALSIVTTFQSLDIEAFLDTNRTRNSLKQALSEHDSYYKTVADSATELNRKAKAIQSKISQLEKEIEELKTDNERLKDKNAALKTEMSLLNTSNKALKSVVDTYVYPELANHLLVQDGYLTNTNDVIMKDAFDENVVTADTKIFSESNVIQGLFNKFKDKE